jgi:hypothetical protein
MHLKSSLLYFGMALALLSGCATGPKYPEVAPKFGVLAADHGRVFIYRATAMGAAVQPEVRLNGEVIGKATPRGFFYVDRSPGHYEMMTSTEVDRKLTFTLEPGQTRFVRLDISIGFFVGHVYPELVDVSVGETEIQDCSYIGKP